MKQGLHYGRITWSYQEDFDPKVHCRPTPFITFNPVRINGKIKTPNFSDKISLEILKHKSDKKYSFRDVYKRWYLEGSWIDRDLGEGRAFLRWMKQSGHSVEWKGHDFSLHPYFTSQNAPKHSSHDEMAKGLSFAVKPVEVHERKIKLYLMDEAVLNLLSLPYGEDTDFIELVMEYVKRRFEWEKWKAPAPTFLDWVKAGAKRPVFMMGQLGFNSDFYQSTR